jgi:hypothetical protein
MIPSSAQNRFLSNAIIAFKSNTVKLHYPARVILYRYFKYRTFERYLYP